MAYKDLQQYIDDLRKKELLNEIEVEVDSDLEITEITDRVSKQYGKALLFKNVKNSPYPVLINSMGTYERLNMGLGVKDLDDIADTILDFMDVASYATLIDKIKAIPKLSWLARVFPTKVKRAACQQVIEEPDLDKLPILKCWPQDGGRYITLPLVITKDPETGQQNMGMYRMQVYDKKTTGMHWHWHKDGREIYEKYKKLGKKMPVSVALGCDPAVIYSATAPLPKMIDEMIFAGFLRKSPVSLVKCVTNDIYVPANAEFVLEGYVDLDEMRLEGPFGDHTGYYSLADMYPVFHIEKITRKKNPVYPTTIVGKPPMEDCYLGKATERIFMPLIKVQNPEIIDMNFPLEGVFHNCVIVSIKKAFPKQAHKIMNGLWGMGQMMYTKMIIVVDENVNPHDIPEVARKVFNNVDVKRDLNISEGPLDALDHASNTAFYGHRLGIDATEKWTSEGYDIDTSEDIQNQATKVRESATKEEIIHLIKEKTSEIVDINVPLQEGFNNCIIVSIRKTLPKHGHKIIKEIWTMEQMKYTKMIIVVDENVNPHDLSIVAWKVFNNIDAKRDLSICGNRLGIDATRKLSSDGHTRDWPDDIDMSKEIKDLVESRWNEYGIK